MATIQLNGAEWTYDENARLGPPGGFGEVFRGAGAGRPVAVKRLKLTAGEAAHREMGIGMELATRTLKHVVPVLDYGQDVASEAYFLIMPIAERSLADEIATKGVLTLDEAKTVALDIVAGLQEVGDIVHRDLKPGNVLFLDGTWKLADFGIAKFVEKSTSRNTLRGFLTDQYGAPEQWLGEASTKATDVYALGCIMHAMLNGEPPFSGSRDQIRQAHLEIQAPPLGGNARLSSFVGQMLRKPAGVRPTLDRCVEIISFIGSASAKPLNAALVAAADKVAREAAEAEAAAMAAATVERQRRELVTDATSELSGILSRLFDEIISTSEEARCSATTITMGRGSLAFSSTSAVRASPSANPYGQPTWNVSAYATMALTRAGVARPANDHRGHPVIYVGRVSGIDLDYTWGSTLFFANSSDDPTYRWREAAFWSMAQGDQRDTPFALAADDKQFAIAFSNVIGVANLAYGPLPIDGEDEENFRHRWLTLFARAASGELEKPHRMPLQPGYFD